MTTEQFFAEPEPAANFQYELHFGVVVKVGLPPKWRFDRQRAIADLLAGLLAPSGWLVGMKMPYGLTADYDARAAEVGVCSRARWDTVSGEDFLIGSPDLVVQIDLERDAIAHLTHGATAVWIVKPEQQEVVVVTAQERKAYRHGEELDVLGQARIPTDVIFSTP